MKRYLRYVLIPCLAMVSLITSAQVIEVERIIDGVEYECLYDTNTKQILHCERD